SSGIRIEDGHHRYHCHIGIVGLVQRAERHSLLTVCGESNSVDEKANALEYWNLKLKSMLQNYHPDDNVNETASGCCQTATAQKPRCFKKIKPLPLPFKCPKRAWMDAQFFTEWSTIIDRKML
ncbi:hypothetical protein MAR_025591, partial [Mya arenaria]